MPFLFSYGTLQDAAVQKQTFGRPVRAERDALPGFERVTVAITDPASVAELGPSHVSVAPSETPDSAVVGSVLEVSDAELAAADRYEAPAGYTRKRVRLASGKAAWVYARVAEIRAARPTEAAEWLRMRQALWPDDDHRPAVERFFAGHRHEPKEVLLALGVDGRVAGFVELSIRTIVDGCDTDRVGYLEGWYVESGRRGQGIGRALVVAAERWAAEQGCTEFASDATLENTASIAAHRALDFTETGRVVSFRKRLRPT
jgi:aminoglycoside 6'-N-acetyltransferase I